MIRKFVLVLMAVIGVNALQAAENDLKPRLVVCTEIHLIARILSEVLIKCSHLGGDGENGGVTIRLVDGVRTFV